MGQLAMEIELNKRPLPMCAAEGCTSTADPRWYAHGPDGSPRMICDGHEGTPCKGGGLVGMSGSCDLEPATNVCTCPPMRKEDS
jgi:hypothetical protein